MPSLKSSIGPRLASGKRSGISTSLTHYTNASPSSSSPSHAKALRKASSKASGEPAASMRTNADIRFRSGKSRRVLDAP